MIEKMKELLGTVLGIASLILGSILGSKIAYDMDGFSAVVCVFVGAITGGGVGGWLYSVVTSTSAKKNDENQSIKSHPQDIALAETMIVSSYRKIAFQKGIAPTFQASDNKIIEIYSWVGSAFKEASKQRKEHISIGCINTIVLKFLQVYEIGGDAMVNEHLKYEVSKYLREGLRNDYRDELRLF